MRYFNHQKCTFHNPVITMGTFDGIHRGHQKLLRELRRRADEINGEAIVVTYYHHPLETIHRKTFPYLLTERYKKEQLLKEFGVDHVLYLNFDEKMAAMEPEEFLKAVIIDELQPREIVVGYDTHFGKKRSGDFSFLQKREERYQFKSFLVAPCAVDDVIVSSSMIRDLVREGDMLQVEKYLGRKYSIVGQVISGHKIGRKLGFPTLNLQPHDGNKLIPALGVYVSQVIIAGKTYGSVTNIGYSPTIKTTGIKEVETHLLNFEQEIYQQDIELIFLKRLRDEIKYVDKAALIQQIALDVQQARDFLAKFEKR
ncbi:MAG: bifunctional riboflavin kinase/FAD synthetase [Candidatus Cloacimonadales bacterium]